MLGKECNLGNFEEILRKKVTYQYQFSSIRFIIFIVSIKERRNEKSDYFYPARNLGGACVFAGGGKDGSAGKTKVVIFAWADANELAVREQTVELINRKLAPKNIVVEASWLPPADVDTKLDAALNAGNAGDIIMMSPDWYGLRSKWFEDLGPYFKRDGVNTGSVYLPGIYENYILANGMVEAVPYTGNSMVIAYNRDIFDKTGVPYPNANWTWDDFADIAAKLTSGSGVNKIYGCTDSSLVFARIYSLMFGGSIYDKNWRVHLNEPNSIKGASFFYDLTQKGYLPDQNITNTMAGGDLFVAGKAAMYPMPGWEASGRAEAIGNNFKWDIVVLPKNADGRPAGTLFLTGYAMSKASGNKDAAWEVLKLLSIDKEVMDLTCQIALPSFKDSAENTYGKTNVKGTQISNKPFVDGFAAGFVNPYGGAIKRVEDATTRSWERIFLLGENPQTVIPALAAEMQGIFDDYQKTWN
jgi:multiple sugar transport system substrate-binding protein